MQLENENYCHGDGVGAALFVLMLVTKHIEVKSNLTRWATSTQLNFSSWRTFTFMEGIVTQHFTGNKGKDSPACPSSDSS
ncbi:hypothetical protein RRG08_003448 [Elysia crispata]|uniref:Uncharacterized protein n=1 Tax=Elysia crispata TaxID=231223 RepID=A0AAE1AB40_9GAST|nr:hypothetical protein RRG08_003448 [Elysia crispata]